MYSEDASLVALALSAYQETHYSQEYYSYLKSSADFIVGAQTSSGDFYEYFDLTNQSWNNGGRLYSWNPYAMMGPAYAAFVITSQSQGERTYWAGVIEALRKCVDSMVVPAQTNDGAVVFYFADGSTRPDVAANAALLVSLTYIALFEHYWGDGKSCNEICHDGTKYRKLVILLSGDMSTLLGALVDSYSDQSRTLQPLFENGLIMFGLNSYYKAASLLSLFQNFHPSISDLRQAMIDWMVGYVEKMFDSWGGVAYERTSGSVIPYPKTTMAISSVLQATVDVWINIGPEVYWNDSSRLYEWMTGNNELSLDLQSDMTLAGSTGRFYAGIDRNGTMGNTDLSVDALTLYALVRAAYVSIPGDYPVSFETTTTRTSSTTIEQTTEETTARTTTTQTTIEPSPYLLFGMAVVISIVFLAGALTLRAKRSRLQAKVRKPSRRTARRRKNGDPRLSSNSWFWSLVEKRPQASACSEQECSRLNGRMCRKPTIGLIYAMTGYSPSMRAVCAHFEMN